MLDPVVLLDLDGVLRRWDPEIIAGAEHLHGLPPGSLAAAAFGDADLLADAVTGRLDDERWRAEIATRLAEHHGPAARLVVRDWSEPAGAVAADVLEVVRELRGGGTKVGLLTNATTRLHDDLRRLGLDRELDVVVGTAAIGVAKPDRAAFRAACTALGTRPENCLFVDDTARNVEAAAAMRMQAHHFVGVEQLRTFLGRFGLPGGDRRGQRGP